MKRFFKSVLAVLIVGAVTAAALYFTQGGDQPARGRRWARAEGPVPVLATQAKLADIPVWLEGVGSAKARNTVTVRPQVDGKILSIDFKEGQEVKVKLLGFDDRGKTRLSMKVVDQATGEEIKRPEKAEEEAPADG